MPRGNIIFFHRVHSPTLHLLLPYIILPLSGNKDCLQDSPDPPFPIYLSGTSLFPCPSDAPLILSKQTLITLCQPGAGEWPEWQVRSPTNNIGSGEE